MLNKVCLVAARPADPGLRTLNRRAQTGYSVMCAFTCLGTIIGGGLLFGYGGRLQLMHGRSHSGPTADE